LPNYSIKSGLVAKVLTSEELLEQAVKIGETIDSKGGISAKMAKEALKAAEELSLQDGLQLERVVSFVVCHARSKGSMCIV
jgi:enoyl-CoA hydratase